jgi:hypothetical protein
MGIVKRVVIRLVFIKGKGSGGFVQNPPVTHPEGALSKFCATSYCAGALYFRRPLTGWVSRIRKNLRALMTLMNLFITRHRNKTKQ